MLIKYKGELMTIHDVCTAMHINYDDFMAWCKKHALQKYDGALGFYRRTLKKGK